jgi:hypothetical protein
MNDLAWAAVMLVGIIITVILIGGVMGFLRWLISRIVTGIVWSLRTLLWAIAFGSRWLALALQVAASYAAAQGWRLCAAGLRHLTMMIGKGVSRLMASIRDGWRGRDASRESERVDPSDDAAADDQDAGHRQQAQQDAAASAYAEALDLMGLTGVEPLTGALLKQRYGELIRIVHPDKGFPNRVFAQQINAAVMTIKKAHGWR